MKFGNLSSPQFDLIYRVGRVQLTDGGLDGSGDQSHESQLFVQFHYYISSDYRTLVILISSNISIISIIIIKRI